LGGTPLPPGAEPLGDINHKGLSLRLFRRFLEAPEADALHLELEAFRDVAAGKQDPPVSGDDGLRALALAERIVAAINQH